MIGLRVEEICLLLGSDYSDQDMLYCVADHTFLLSRLQSCPAHLFAEFVMIESGVGAPASTTPKQLEWKRLPSEAALITF
jgi:ATP adenylyltransferase/5',5'''-P-1,P-4-tetraphosphate phosphorylase II